MVHDLRHSRRRKNPAIARKPINQSSKAPPPAPPPVEGSDGAELPACCVPDGVVVGGVDIGVGEGAGVGVVGGGVGVVITLVDTRAVNATAS